MPHIRSLEEQYRREAPGLALRGILISEDRMAELPVAAFWPSHIPRFRVPEAMAIHAHNGKEMTVEAFVNDGRWLVKCPMDGCGGAQLASRKDPRFYCNECLNAGALGYWLRVTWPDDADEIEEVLRHRPLTTQQNWRPGETVADLRAENDEHGVTH
jgi:hypothetical protein